MKILYHFFIILAVSYIVEATYEGSYCDRSCRDPPVRREWRTLSTQQKAEYINAVNCLASRRTRSGFNSTLTRFDDFVAVHSSQTPYIHFVGFFLLWHRYYVAAYERALRVECGYRGGQPYWDWTLENAPGVNFRNSPVFDPENGFGGNGPFVDGPNFLGILHEGGGCVQDGPFTHLILSVGPGPWNASALPNPHCLTRDFAPDLIAWLTATNVAHVMSQPDYTSFARAIEGIPSFAEPNIHGGGHFGVGGALGIMGDMNCSPGDPIFYLHHGNLDRLLWIWQKQDLGTRLHQVGGPIIPFDYSGANVTLDFEVNLGQLGAALPLKELLNIKGNSLCYDYE